LGSTYFIPILISIKSNFKPWTEWYSMISLPNPEFSANLKNNNRKGDHIQHEHMSIHEEEHVTYDSKKYSSTGHVFICLLKITNLSVINFKIIKNLYNY